MKKILCIIILSFFSLYCFSQAAEEYIGNYTLNNLIQNKQYENNYKSGTLFPLKYYKIAFHIVRTSAGTTERQGIESDINKAIALMNEKYTGANVQFYICDIDYINSDSYYNFNLQDQSVLLNTYNNSDAINVYLFNYMYSGTNQYWGYTYMPGYTYASTNLIALRHSTFDELVTITHEFGHFFGLPHTHNDFGSSNNEFVDGSNCDKAGDFFCDTPADPKLDFNNDVDINCNYTGAKIDAHGDSYDPATDLIMSYARHSCRTRFSLEQLSSLNFWANTQWRTCFSHMYTLENTTLSSNQTIIEDAIVFKNVNVTNNATITLIPCAIVEISGDSKISLGSTLIIQ